MTSPLVLVLAVGAASLSVAAGSPTSCNDGYLYYDSFNATILADYQLRIREIQNNTRYCVNAVAVCDETERRRIDGSCNNLALPPAGSGFSPYSRLLKPNFDKESLPPARATRTRVLAEGSIPNRVFSQLLITYLVFSITDISAQSIVDTLEYSFYTACCSNASASPRCTAHPVLDTDPVLRLGDVRCLNMTRPHTFQDQQCVADNTEPSRLSYGTPFFDLSTLYGNNYATMTRQRLFSGGLLNYTTISNGRQWPTYVAPPTKDWDGWQGLTDIDMVFGIYLWREHNRLAAALADLNPHWGDHELFYTARDINIAQFQQVLYYELFAALIGSEYLRGQGVLSNSTGFRETYDASLKPTVFADSLIAFRWMHTNVPGTLTLYNYKGEKTGERDITFIRESTLTENSSIENYTQAFMRQPSGDFDSTVDPVMSELGLGNLQQVSDLTANDLMKNRLNGLPPYTSYLNLCYGGEYDTWESIAPFIKPEQMGVLRGVYSSVQEVELLAALWSERPALDAHVPATFRCLVARQLLRTVRSDRHWFEREDRPHAFTAEQLSEIRKTTAARLLCDNGDSVEASGVQPRAFYLIGPGNELTSCDNIPALDISKWKSYNG